VPTTRIFTREKRFILLGFLHSRRCCRICSWCWNSCW